MVVLKFNNGRSPPLHRGKRHVLGPLLARDSAGFPAKTRKIKADPSPREGEEEANAHGKDNPRAGVLQCFYGLVLAMPFPCLQLPHAGAIPMPQQDARPLPGHAVSSQVQQACY